VTATFEKVELAVDERVGAAWCAAAARCAAPDVVNVNSGVRVDARAAVGDAGAHGVRAGEFCRFNEWARPGRLPQRRARGKRSDAAKERRKRVWLVRSCRRTRASNLIVAAVRRRAAQLLVAARETDDGCAGGAAWRRDGGRLSRVEATTTTETTAETTTAVTTTATKDWVNMRATSTNSQSSTQCDDDGGGGDGDDDDGGQATTTTETTTEATTAVTATTEDWKRATSTNSQSSTQCDDDGDGDGDGDEGGHLDSGICDYGDEANATVTAAVATTNSNGDAPWSSLASAVAALPPLWDEGGVTVEFLSDIWQLAAEHSIGDVLIDEGTLDFAKLSDNTYYEHSIGDVLIDKGTLDFAKLSDDTCHAIEDYVVDIVPICMNLNGPWTDDDLRKIKDYATIQPKLSIGRLLARLQAGSG
jgi:hypothetical protein